MRAVLGWVFGIFILVVSMGLPKDAQAQSGDDLVWVQIEAHPSLSEAAGRAALWAERLDDVNGFTLRTGWHAILLGPYAPEDAVAVLRDLGGRGVIPRDSYVAFTRSFTGQYWPQGVDLLGTGTLQAATTGTGRGIGPDTGTGTDTGTGAQTALVPQVPDETVAQARASEAQLSAEERQDLQRALRWAGYYNAAIDGAFGRGTRGSMSDWQAANGYAPTGVLTTAQRAALLEAYNAVLAGLGMRVYTDDMAGIAVKLPADALRFDTYDYPFAKFAAADAVGAELLLISQPGDRARLGSLYNILQTLDFVPLEGPRTLGRNTFEIEGRNATRATYARAELERGTIKGFVLSWPAGDEARRLRVIDEMRQSFRRLDGALDPSQSLTSQQAIDLVAGLQIRQPVRTGSGFFVDTTGAIMTASAVVQDCTRVTLDDGNEASIDVLDTGLGVALLLPQSALAPAAVAQLSETPPRLASDVAAAGYSYGGVLSAATLTYGTLADLHGLRGEEALVRLDLEALEGDAGGPVFDTSGQVIGLLLPREDGARDLPAEVSFALKAKSLRGLLDSRGPAPQPVSLDEDPSPQDIADHAREITVLVSCWN